MDYGKAFGFVFEDKDWVSKIIIGGLLSLISFFLIPMFIVLGYQLEVTQRVMRGEKGLPEWNKIGDKLRKGFLLVVSYFIYLIPVFVIFLIPAAVAFIFGIASADITDNAAGTIVSFVFLFAIIAIFIYIILFYLLMPVIVIRYAKDGELGDALKVSEVFKQVKNNIGQVILLVIFMFIASIIGGLGAAALIIGAVFTTFYAQLMLFHLYGQFAKLVEE